MAKKMKKFLKISGILILVLMLFRGVIFRLVIKYNDIGTRSVVVLTNKKLIEKIDRESDNIEIDIKSILSIANGITTEALGFTTGQASNNPNQLINSKQANCVGYSAMFNSIADYLIRKNNLQGEIKAEHKVGQLELFGINLHQYFESSFFKDHDYNELVDKKTGDKIAIDPTVSDYLWIKRVATRD